MRKERKLKEEPKEKDIEMRVLRKKKKKEITFQLNRKKC